MTSDAPLLAVDGDSLAHRAYHALPKSIRGARGRPSNALVGFANFLLRLWDAEAPAAVLVGWDTLDVPTYRHEALPVYQSGREFARGLAAYDSDECRQIRGEASSRIDAILGYHDGDEVIHRDDLAILADLAADLAADPGDATDASAKEGG